MHIYICTHARIDVYIWTIEDGGGNSEFREIVCEDLIFLRRHKRQERPQIARCRHYKHLWHLYMWHDWLIFGTWLIQKFDEDLIFLWRHSRQESNVAPHCTLPPLQTPVKWLIHTCGMTHWYLGRDSFRCVTWFQKYLNLNTAVIIHTYYMTHSNVWYESFICVTWLESYRKLSAAAITNTCVNTNTCRHYKHLRQHKHLPPLQTPASWVIHRCDTTHS